MKVPVREVSGLVNGLKAGLMFWRAGRRSLDAGRRRAFGGGIRSGRG